MPISKIKTSSITADAASVNLNIDANTLFLDVANNRVGINNTSPSSSLYVTGSANDQMVRVGHSNATNTQYISLYANNAEAFYNSTNTQNGNYGAHVWNATNNAGTVERARIDGVGNVGFGTALPAANLHVNSAGGGTIRASRSSVSGEYIQMDHDGTNGTIRASGANSLIFNTNSAERARITSGGQFLVGNTTTSGGEIARFQTSSGATSVGIIAATNGSSFLNFGDTADANVGFIGYDHTNNYMHIRTNGAERIRIDSSGTVLIGTTSVPSNVEARPGTVIVNSGNGTSDTGSLAIIGNQGAAAELIISGGNSTTNRRAGIRWWSQQYSSVSPTWSQGVSFTQSNGDGNMTFINQAGSTTLTLLQGGQTRFSSASGQTRTENGVATWFTSGTTGNNNSLSFDIAVPDDGGTGTGHHIEANMTHINWGSYGCFLDTWVSTRGNAVQEVRDNFNVTSANGGSWSVSKPNNTTLRVTKNAGTYPGGGYYWIKVTTINTV